MWCGCELQKNIIDQQMFFMQNYRTLIFLMRCASFGVSSRAMKGIFILFDQINLNRNDPKTKRDE